MDDISISDFIQNKKTMYSVKDINDILYYKKSLLRLIVFNNYFSNKVVIPNYFLLSNFKEENDYCCFNGFDVFIKNARVINYNDYYISSTDFEDILSGFIFFMNKNNLINIHNNKYKKSKLLNFIIKDEKNEPIPNDSLLTYDFLVRNLKHHIDLIIRELREEELHQKMSLIKKDETTIVRKKI